MINEKSYSLITSRNLRRLIFEKQVEQKDVAKAIGVSQSIVSSWVNGTRTPKMKNIDALCRYFNCKRSDIMEAPGTVHENEITDEQAELIQLTMKASPDNVKLALALLRKLESVK